MTVPLLAIVKLTFKASLRSHVFQALLLLLALGVLVVPNTVKGDGTAYGFVQVSIDYSMWTISIILSMSAVWLGCSTLSTDIENGQLHMVVSKPVSRILVYSGKLLGVLALHGILLLLAAFCAFAFVQMQLKLQKFSPSERARLDDEVLVGRRAYLSDIPDVESRVRSEFEARAKTLANLTGKPFESLPPSERNKLLSDVRKQVVAGFGEVKGGMENTKYWTFSGLPEDYDGVLSVRYKAYSGSPDAKDQKTTYGIWGAKAYFDDKMMSQSAAQAGLPTPAPAGKGKTTEVYLLRSNEPERIVCGLPLEFKLPAKMVLHDGKVQIGLTNFDPESKAMYLQPSDSPKLLIKRCSFLENFSRAVFVAFMRIAALAVIACAAGAVFSMPVAVFMVVAYIGIGLFASFLLGTQETYGENPNADFMEKFGLVASKTVMLGVMPLQRFEVSDKLANGELIELSFIGRLFLECIVLKGLPLCALGAWLYWRRELALSFRR